MERQFYETNETFRYKHYLYALLQGVYIRNCCYFHTCIFICNNIFIFKLSFWKAGNVSTFYFSHSASNVTERISKQQQLPVRFLSSLKLEAAWRKRNILLSSSITLKPRKRTGSPQDSTVLLSWRLDSWVKFENTCKLAK